MTNQIVRIYQMFQNQCPICLQEIKERTSPACCRHTFCALCIHQWLTIKNSCPLCIKTSEEEPRNRLKNIYEQEFDFSLISLDGQVQAAGIKLKEMRGRIKSLSETHAYRSSFPRAKLSLAREETREAEQIYDEVVIKMSVKDQMGCALLLQELTQILLEVQLILNQQIILDYDQQEDQEEEEQQFYRHIAKEKGKKQKRTKN